MARPTPNFPPVAADERTTLLAFLDFFRAALVDRAYGLDKVGLRQTHPPSTLSLARLIGHMARVEYVWFRVRFSGDELPAVFADLHWGADPDADMTLAESLDADDLEALLSDAIEDSRSVVAAASLDDVSVRPNRDGDRVSLRWIVIHMIEEYARHCGHADLIRESIDGNTAS